MGFLDFLFKSKQELADFAKANRRDNFYKEGMYSFVKYTDKGISKSSSKKNPWRAQLNINKKSKDGEYQTINFHIGVYSTKEEAQKARWEFIENLK